MGYSFVVEVFPVGTLLYHDPAKCLLQNNSKTTEYDKEYGRAVAATGGARERANTKRTSGVQKAEQKYATSRRSAVVLMGSDKEGSAPAQAQQVHSNGLIVTPLQDSPAELPASIPAGYPEESRGRHLERRQLRSAGNHTLCGSTLQRSPKPQGRRGSFNGRLHDHAGVPMEHTGGRPTPMYHMYYNQPSYQEMQAGAPAPVVQGAPHVGPMNTSAPLYCAANQDPVFLGATVGHHPIPIHCGACGFQGLSHVTCAALCHTPKGIICMCCNGCAHPCICFSLSCASL